MEKSRNFLIPILIAVLILFVAVMFFYGCEGCIRETHQKITTVKTWVFFRGIVMEIGEDENGQHFALVEKYGQKNGSWFKVYFKDVDVKKGGVILVKADTLGGKPPYHLVLHQTL